MITAALYSGVSCNCSNKLKLFCGVSALITISRMKPITSSSIYIAMISLIDAFNLIFKLSYLLLTLYDIRLYDGGCKTMYFMGTFFMHYSNWLLVSMTIERFVAIWFPLKVTKFPNIIIVLKIISNIHGTMLYAAPSIQYQILEMKYTKESTNEHFQA
jgi:hypothetical protein